MPTFTLAISCLTTSNLPWFMDLTFQVPIQYCSLQHQTLLLSPVTSFFLELFLHWSLVTYWAPTEFIFQCPIFLPFHTVHNVQRQEYWSSLSFPSPVDHILSELSTMTHPVGWLYTAWLMVSLSYTRLWSMWSDWLVFCDCDLQSVCPLIEKDKRLMETSWWDRLTEGETWSCSDGQGHAQ